MKHQGFYEVGAQVIPLLFFALLFELRWFEGSGKRTSARFALFDIAVIVLAAVGEVVRYEDIYRLCYVRGPEGIG